MNSITICMRERCAMEAFQMWVDSKSPGFRVVGVKAEAPCSIELQIIEEKKPDDGANR